MSKEDQTPKSDPIEIWELHKNKQGQIVALVSRGGVRYTKEDVVQMIFKGQTFLVTSEDGDSSALDVVGSSDHTLRTVRDETELNNLGGNSNLKVCVVEDES